MFHSTQAVSNSTLSVVFSLATDLSFFFFPVITVIVKTVKDTYSSFLFVLVRLTLGALGLKLNDYWKEVTEKKAREREFQALDRDEEDVQKEADE